MLKTEGIGGLRKMLPAMEAILSPEILVCLKI